MKIPDDIFERFPDIIKDDIQNNDIDFPECVLIQYEDFIAFRCIARKDGDTLIINKKDFDSQVYLRKDNKRNVLERNDISEYSCSVFGNKKDLYLKMRLPRKNKYIIRGHIKSIYGIIDHMPTINNSHVNWWLFDNSDPSQEFEVIME